MKSFGSVAAKSNCIQLHRFVRLGDKADSQVFTFIVPSQLTRGFVNAAQSKEFPYGGQSWQLQLCLQHEDSATKSEEALTNGKDTQRPAAQKAPLNIGLSLCGGLAGMKCQLEMIRYTLLNRESVNSNITHEEREVTFTADDSTCWKMAWVGTDQLATEHFLFDDWTWLVEVELQNASTTYEEFLTLPKGYQKDAANRTGLRLESASFTFAGSDWNVSLTWPQADQKKHSISSFMRSSRSPSEANASAACPRVKLQRHSRTNHWCRVRYKATLIWGAMGESSFGPVDHLITADNGATTTGCVIGEPKWFTAGPLPAKQRVKIIIEMLAAAPVSRIDLIPIAPQGGKNFARCKDPDGHDWVVLSDILGTLVRLRFFPVVEVHYHENGAATSGAGGFTKEGSSSQIPDKPCELRCVAWNVHLIPHETSRGVVKALNSPYVSYVPTFRCSVSASRGGRRDSSELSRDTQQMMIHPDEVTEVALDLPVEKVIDTSSGYIRPNDNAMTIRIEWLQSQRLYQSNYNVYDDLVHTQKKQLARELRALQLENYSLEKQLLMSNVPSSVELNVPEPRVSTLSQSMKQLNDSSPPSSPELSLAPRKSMSKLTSSPVAVSRRLPEATYRTSPSNGGFLSTKSITTAEIRRHSSSFAGAIESQGRPRRSLPSPGVPSTGGSSCGGGSGGGGSGSNWRSQKRCLAGDDGFSEGYKSRDDSPVQHLLQVGVNGSSSENLSNMSSPTWRHQFKTSSGYQKPSRPHTATSATSLAQQSHRDHQRPLTPTLVFSLSSEDNFSGGGAL
ncbi:unnamed protein product [Mesocestoides corti]|uniref:MATH domain-containing protein n=2 Tax=Mesocestoides corti TaxID=53468 RepID=A0A158QS94_MESCO|nr:unnamed protein product [Mesocestoides corti]